MEVSLPFNSKAKGLLLMKGSITTPGTAPLVSRDNTHNNGQAFRSSHSFHLEKGAFFCKDSDTVANPSLREFGEGGLFLSRERRLNKISRQTESGAGTSVSYTGPSSPTRSPQEISTTLSTASLFFPLLACRERIPLSPHGE